MRPNQGNQERHGADPKIAGKTGLESLARIVHGTGTDRFYAELASFAAATLHCERWLVMRYPRYSTPEFVFNTALSNDAVEYYLNGLYRLDPLLRLVRGGVREGAFTLSTLKASKTNRTYFDRLFQMSLIYDEAAVLLPAPGGGSISICIERAARQFSGADITLLKRLYSLFRGLHDLHLDRVFAAPSPKARQHMLVGTEQAVLILDRQHRIVFHNVHWVELERQGRIPPLDMINELPAGERPLDCGNVLHWEELRDTFAIAPGGRICLIETRSPGYVATGLKAALSRLQDRYGLTRREREITDLLLQGHPNAKIAKRLGLTAGTVRNHRHRLYSKMDITTEREVFFLFIDLLVERAAPAG